MSPAGQSCRTASAFGTRSAHPVWGAGESETARVCSRLCATDASRFGGLQTARTHASPARRTRLAGRGGGAFHRRGRSHTVRLAGAPRVRPHAAARRPGTTQSGRPVRPLRGQLLAQTGSRWGAGQGGGSRPSRTGQARWPGQRCGGVSSQPRGAGWTPRPLPGPTQCPPPGSLTVQGPGQGLKESGHETAKGTCHSAWPGAEADRSPRSPEPISAPQRSPLCSGDHGAGRRDSLSPGQSATGPHGVGGDAATRALGNALGSQRSRGEDLGQEGSACLRGVALQ